MKFAATRALAVLVLSLAPAKHASFAADRLINMIPQARSGETNQDAEPTISVDPNDFSRLAGSAFTWDNLTEAPMVTATAPIYVSKNSGDTWSLAFVIPSKIGSGFPTGDITLSFSATLSGAPNDKTSWLYGGTLTSAAAGRPMTVLRGQDPFSSTVFSTLDTRTGNVDQPHTLAFTSGAAQDKLYVGFNNGWNCVNPTGRTSDFDVSQDAAITSPSLALDVIDTRNTPCQDGFAQIPAANRDGTVYGAFIHDWSGSPRLVVVRDDNWGANATPFSALKEPSDNVAGRFVSNILTLPSGQMGMNRLGASNISLAVDPHDSDRVYVAWGDSGGTNSETIHVRRSVNRGADWSDDLLTVTNALNPEIAITDEGTVGVLYQQVVANNWETHFVRTKDGDGKVFDSPGVLLAKTSATSPTPHYQPYIGDYASLVKAGRNFVGMFSASNYPDKTNFMPGVKYQREVDWNSHKLYADAAHKVEVPFSIDPFFFEIDTNFRLIDICKFDPILCYPIPDPWWRFKCPECGVQILLDPGEEITSVIMFNEQGRRVGAFEPLKEPVTLRNAKYTHGLVFKPERGVSYILKAQTVRGRKLTQDFNPNFIMRKAE